MNGLKMGPKHKGFPMTQSIHFDSEKKRKLFSYCWVLHLLEAQEVLKLFIKSSFK